MRYNRFWPASRQSEHLIKRADHYLSVVKMSRAELTRLALTFFLDKAGVPEPKKHGLRREFKILGQKSYEETFFGTEAEGGVLPASEAIADNPVV